MSTEIDRENIQVGDKIEATHTKTGDVIIGFVKVTNSHRIELGSFRLYSEDWEFRLLFRPEPAPKVGDAIHGKKVNTLPVGSIVTKVQRTIDGSRYARWVVTQRTDESVVLINIHNNTRQHDYFKSGLYTIDFLGDSDDV